MLYKHQEQQKGQGTKQAAEPAGGRERDSDKGRVRNYNGTSLRNYNGTSLGDRGTCDSRGSGNN